MTANPNDPAGYPLKHLTINCSVVIFANAEIL
jgi:hypothetical protein